MKGILLNLAFILSFCACSEEGKLAEVINPQQAILGKWEVIENTFGPVTYPGSYREFRLDSILFDYNSENDSSYSEYWFADAGSLWEGSDSLLFIKHTYIDQISGDTLLVDIWPYQYDFINYNKLRLLSVYPAINPTTIYQRIK